MEAKSPTSHSSSSNRTDETISSDTTKEAPKPSEQFVEIVLNTILKDEPLYLREEVPLRWKICSIVPIFIEEQKTLRLQIIEDCKSCRLKDLISNGLKLRAISTWNTLAITTTMPIAAAVNIVSFPFCLFLGSFGFWCSGLFESPDRDCEQLLSSSIICCEFSKQTKSAVCDQLMLTIVKATCLAKDIILPEPLAGCDADMMSGSFRSLSIDNYLSNPTQGLLKTALSTFYGRTTLDIPPQVSMMSRI